MNHRRALALTAALSLAAIGVSAQTGTRQVRTFPQFAGSWVLDEAASTGPLLMAPRVARSLTIATSPTTVTVTKELILSQSDTIAPTSEEVYRFDGKPTVRDQGSLTSAYSFALVADALALTRKDEATNRPGFTMATEAYSVDGDVLTVHRQLTSVTAEGTILVMQEPRNNSRLTYVYRRRP